MEGEAPGKGKLGKDQDSETQEVPVSDMGFDRRLGKAFFLMERIAELTVHVH